MGAELAALFSASCEKKYRSSAAEYQPTLKRNFSMAFGSVEPSPIPTNPVRNGGFHHCERRITQPLLFLRHLLRARRPPLFKPPH